MLQTLFDSKAVYEDAVRKWGQDSQRLMFAEEVGEGLQALSKLYRDPSLANKLVFAAEAADILIMLEQICQMYYIDKDLINNFYEQKLERLAERLST